MPLPFWKTKPLDRLTPAEWESLCDGCGRCCLLKLEDEDTGRIATTNVVCRLLDLRTCRCRKYNERQRLVPDCVLLTPQNIDKLRWMPATCAYRLLAEGKDLPSWHPLVSGSRDTVHDAGASVRAWAVSERGAGPLEDHVIEVLGD